ncbi:MAG: acyl-CoA dehydrogenase, partial [Alphaproteobacteria bacterium]|nr:acyl-CoA dehydrogenase [Alphaproteobacteria bacterium]
MGKVDQQDLKEFGEAANAWFGQNTPGDPGFLLPLTFLEVGTDQQFEFMRDWQRKVYEAGYLGAAWPKEYGGGGLDQAFQNAATKAMRAHHAPIMLNAIGLNWTGPLLLEMGSENQKKKYIKNILSAEDIWCQGFSEPENGSDLGNAQLRAVRDGDDYILNGSKIWTTQGNYAKYMILLARTNTEAPNKYAGLSFFLSPMTVDGIETTPIRKITGEYGFTQTFFTDARIPTDCRMGAEGEGWLIAMRTLEYERGARGGQAGGYVMTPIDAFAILELAKKAVREGAPVMDDPIMRDKLVEFIIEGQALGLCGERGRFAQLNQDRPMALALSGKLMWSEFIRRLSEFAMTLLGTKGGYYVGDENA